MFAIGLPSSGHFAIGAIALDYTAPTLQAARISGNSLRLTMSEPVTVVDATGWTVNLSGGAASLTYYGGSGTRYLYYTLSRSVAQDETGTLSYSRPTYGIEDLSGNDLESIVARAVSVASGEVAYPYSQMTTADIIHDVAQEVIL